MRLVAPRTDRISSKRLLPAGNTGNSSFCFDNITEIGVDIRPIIQKRIVLIRNGSTWLYVVTICELKFDAVAC